MNGTHLVNGFNCGENGKNCCVRVLAHLMIASQILPNKQQNGHGQWKTTQFHKKFNFLKYKNTPENKKS